MVSNRSLSNASIPSSVPDKGKNLLRSVRTSARFKHCVIKKDVVKSEAEIVPNIESSMDDLKNVDAMTVQELRKKLRSVGLSTKGYKGDLMLAYKSFLDNKIVGTNSQAIDEQHSTEIKPICDDNVFSKMKVGIDIPTNPNEPWVVLAHKKPQKDWIPYNPKIMRPTPLATNTKSMKIMSWNVNGLRALLKLEATSALQLAQREDFDILCLQETKIQEKDVEAIKQRLIDGYENSFWTCSVSKLGYSGTAIISRIKPHSVQYGLGIADHDSEGRLITAEFDTFYLLAAYVPNSGDGLKRLPYRVTKWDTSLSCYMKELEKTKPVILTGDLNCAYEEIDIYDPAGNKRSAGFTSEERESFGSNFLFRGFVDTFRKQHPNVVGYTYWGYRHGARKANRGWRLDYFLVSNSIADKVHDSYILPDIVGSDHCPVGLVLKN